MRRDEGNWRRLQRNTNTAESIQGSFCIVLGLAKVHYNNTFNRLKSSANALAEKETINKVCIVHIHTPSCLLYIQSFCNKLIFGTFYFLSFSHWRG